MSGVPELVESLAMEDSSDATTPEVLDRPAVEGVCTAHEGQECSLPTTHAIVTEAGVLRAYACRVGQRYTRKGERIEALPGQPKSIKFNEGASPPPAVYPINTRPASTSVGDLQETLEDVVRLRGLSSGDARALATKVLIAVASRS